jgi:hypothetical protein
MKQVSLFVLVFFPLLFQCQTSEKQMLTDGRKLVWTDEFDYTGLPDPQNWGYESGFVRNKEAQYYTKERLNYSFNILKLPAGMPS